MQSLMIQIRNTVQCTCKQKQTMQSTSSTSAGTSDTVLDSAVQQQINVQILAQLSAINQRLNFIENKGSKNSSDLKKNQKIFKD